MVQITLENSKVVSYNLSSIHQEQKLYNAWWAMSDMPKYRDTKIRLVTHDGQTILYEIKEIKACKVITEVAQDTSQGSCEKPDEDEYNRVIQKLLEGCVENLIFNFSSDEKRKLVMFYARLIDLGVNPDPSDPIMLIVIRALLEDSGNDVQAYVEMYMDYHKKEKQC